MIPVLLLVLRRRFWAWQVSLHVHTLVLFGCGIGISKT